MPGNRVIESPDPECRVTLLTPRGRSAVATISVDGPAANSLIAGFFRPLGRVSLDTVSIDRVLVGHWLDQSGCYEEVVLARRSASRIEVHCHGGLAASEAIIRSLTHAGAILATADEWLSRRIEAPIQRAAWQALARASTERSAGVLLDQLRGALSSALQEMIADLRRRSTDLESVSQRLERLIRLADVGVHLSQPWRVAVVGPPNVGKSSLVNALLGYDRSIVFDQPGTTRDVLTAVTALEGWPVELSDTAGFRVSSDQVENEGALRAWRQLEDADLAIIVVDVRQLHASYRQQCQAAARSSLVVASKCDLAVGTPELPSGWMGTSARTGAGIQELIRRLVQTLVPLTPHRGEAVPFTQEQCDALREAQRHVLARDALAATAILARSLE